MISSQNILSFTQQFMNYTCDVAIIGGGPGGYVAAIKAAQLGLKTTCIEKRGALGGTCLNVGCIPSKALLNASHKYHDAIHDFKKWGIKVPKKSIEVDVTQMMKQKQKAVTGLTKGVEFLFKKNKVKYVKGEATIQNPHEITVSNGEKIEPKNIIIATGSDVATLPFLPEIDEKVIISSTGALSLPKIPKKMIVIGAGVIGLEMGSVWSRLGSEVVVVEYLDAVAPFLDSECSKTFEKVLKKQGMDFMLSTKVTGCKKTDKGAVLDVEIMKGKKKGKTTIEGDVVLVAIGRNPYTKNLGLENVPDVKLDKYGRVITDKHFKTGVDNIFAIGDVREGAMLAHKAEEEGIACVENLAGMKGHVNYDAIPSVIYTWPEVAFVGKNEQECKKEGIEYQVGKFPFAGNSRAKTNDDFDGFIKFISEKETDKIIGAHMVGPNVSEMIMEAVIGMEFGASSEDIARCCHAHPTCSEAVKEAAMDCYDKPIHF